MKLKHRPLSDIIKRGSSYIATSGIYRYETDKQTFIVFVKEEFEFKPSGPSWYFRWRNIDPELLMFAALDHDIRYFEYRNRKIADERFFQILYFGGTKLGTCIEIYIVLRMLGWIYWYDLNDYFK